MCRMVIVFVIVGLCVNTAAALPGSGTEADPWRIESLSDFDEFAADPNYWDGYTHLETDINLAGLSYSTAVIAPDTINSNWVFDGTAFTGVFDGNGHKVTNLTIDDEGAGNDYLGLFGYIGEDGEVRNLGLEGGSVSGNDCVGGLMGSNSGIVSDCYSTGSVSGTRYVGGLMGRNVGSVSNCYSIGDVNGVSAVGGLVGQNGYFMLGPPPEPTIEEDVEGLGYIFNSYSTGSVQGTFRVGGLVGDNQFGDVFISYSTGDVSGTEWTVGGLVGYNGGIVSNCCSAGDVSGTGRGVGGLVGNNDGDVSNCYSTGSVSGDTKVGGLVGLNYGSVSNCYSTCDVNGVSIVGGLVGYYCDGSVSNCYSTGPVNGVSYVGGLVGYNDGSVSNCYSTSDVNGIDLVGGLAGGNYEYGSISNCYSTGDVNCPVQLPMVKSVVGLVRLNYYGSVSNCYSTGDVIGYSRVGGLVGLNWGGISNCFWDTDTQTHGVTESIGHNEGTATNVAGLPTAQMQTKSTFTDAGWDFTTPVWTINEGVDYPRLWWDFVPVLHTEPEVTLGTSNIISWEPVVGAVEYYAECAEDANFDNIVYNSGWITETSYEFTGLQLGQRYWYSVKARNSAGIESQWSNVESSLQCTLAEAVEIMLEPKNLKSEKLKKPYINKINMAQEMIDSGNFTSALNKLEKDILQKTNGCGETGEPDKNDWIITCEEQSEVYSLIIETIEYVKSLMQ